MPARRDKPVRLPSAEEIRRAIEIYLAHAYPSGPPAATQRLLPPASFDPARWLMGDCTERDPADAPLAGVRSFAMRLGNAGYPHMKLRLSRPPREQVFVLSVDSHDGFLRAASGSSDGRRLEALKRSNAGIAAAVQAAWDAAGLLTERAYLRRKIREKKGRGGGTAS
jgi:hypothetical protein